MNARVSTYMASVRGKVNMSAMRCAKDALIGSKVATATAAASAGAGPGPKISAQRRRSSPRVDSTCSYQRGSQRRRSSATPKLNQERCSGAGRAAVYSCSSTASFPSFRYMSTYGCRPCTRSFVSAWSSCGRSTWCGGGSEGGGER
jgi:hypothetical protein